MRTSLDHHVEFESILKVIQHRYRAVINNINLFDVYEDERILGKGKKSYALSILFEDPSKTFSDREIDKMMDSIIRDLESQFDAKLR